MKKNLSIIFALLSTAALANQTVTTTASNQTQPVNTTVQQPVTTTANQPVQTQTMQTQQQAPAKPQKKAKPQKPKFNHNEIWCGDTHIKTQNADKIGDYCKDFGYKHHTVELKDDRSGKLIACDIKDNGEINAPTCKVIK